VYAAIVGTGGGGTDGGVHCSKTLPACMIDEAHVLGGKTPANDHSVLFVARVFVPEVS
jgi:hypothetical protein